MANAFDWSPGGCCCDLPGWFDLFYYPGSLQSQEWHRNCAVFPGGAPAGYNSIIGIDWYITPLQKPQSFSGITRDGRNVWSLDGYLSDLEARLALYDATDKVQKFSIAQNAMQAGGFVNMQTRANVMAGNDIFAMVKTGNGVPVGQSIRTVDTNGVVDDWGGNVQGIQTISATEKAIFPAFLHWPKWCGYSSIMGSFAHALFLCDLTKPSGGNTLTMANRQLAYGGSTFARWRGFDYFDGNWGGVIQVGNTGFGVTTSSMRLLINGTQLWARTYPAANLLDTSVQDWPVHVCYPHETLGGGYIALNEIAFTQPVSPITNDYYRNLVIYNNGAEVWRSIDLLADIRVLGSTDRWIYFQTTSRHPTVSQMTGGNITDPTESNRTIFWLVKHDGSEVLPMGTVLDTFGQMGGRPADKPVNADCMMRNSQAAPGPLHASYQEMWDGRSTF